MCGFIAIIDAADRPCCPRRVTPGQDAGDAAHRSAAFPKAITAPDPIARHMLDAIIDRGPDDEGWLVRDGVTLGHRRLAIRDMGGGRQPMISGDERYAIVYNGELYNDAALRRRISPVGGWKTQSDTETVLQAFAHWGPQCTEHLEGMFAFVAVDFQTGRVLAVRDPMGIKPLYHAQVRGRYVFASSVEAIRRHDGIRHEPDMATVSHYLSTLRLTLGERTMLQDVRQLRPGHRMLLEGARCCTTEYWRLPERTLGDAAESSDAIDEFETLFRAAVVRRLVSDRPVGMMLSGGVDSAAIGWVFAGSHDAIHAVVAGEEHADALETAAAIGIRLQSVHPTPQTYLAAWKDLVQRTGLPASTPSDPVISMVAATLKRHVDVTLGGEGADELLCGYTTQHAGMAAMLGDESHTAPTTTQALENYRRENALIDSSAKARWMTDEAWLLAEGDAVAIDEYRRDAFIDALQPRSPSDALYRTIHRVNLEGQLSRLDTATMLHGLEARVPFTDRHLVEAMSRLPIEHHIEKPTANHGSGGLQTKRVLRRWLRKRLPTVADRTKRSFPTPMASYIQGPWLNDCRRWISCCDEMRRWLRPDVMAAINHDPASLGILLWPLTNLAMWRARLAGEAIDGKAA